MRLTKREVVPSLSIIPLSIVPAGIKAISTEEGERTLQSSGFTVMDHPPTMGLLKTYITACHTTRFGRHKRNADGYWELVDESYSPDKLGGFRRQVKDPSVPERVELKVPSLEEYARRLNHLGQDEKSRRMRDDQPVSALQYFESLGFARWLGGRMLKVEEHRFAALSGFGSSHWEWAQAASGKPANCRPHDFRGIRDTLIDGYYKEEDFLEYGWGTFRVCFPHVEITIASGVSTLPDTSLQSS